MSDRSPPSYANSQARPMRAMQSLKLASMKAQ